MFCRCLCSTSPLITGILWAQNEVPSSTYTCSPGHLVPTPHFTSSCPLQDHQDCSPPTPERPTCTCNASRVQEGITSPSLHREHVSPAAAHWNHLRPERRPGRLLVNWALCHLGIRTFHRSLGDSSEQLRLRTAALRPDLPGAPHLIQSTPPATAKAQGRTSPTAPFLTTDPTPHGSR